MITQKTVLIAIISFAITFLGHIVAFGLGDAEELAQALAFAALGPLTAILAGLQGKPVDAEEDDDVTEEEVEGYRRA